MTIVMEDEEGEERERRPKKRQDHQFSSGNDADDAGRVANAPLMPQNCWRNIRIDAVLTSGSVSRLSEG
jgi:hypothetical protein